MSEIKKVVKSKNTFPILPVVVFVGVLVVTVGLFVYTNMLQSWIDETRTSIIKYEAEINKLKENKAVQVAQLLKKNKKVIEVLEERSHISKYIDHLEEIGGALVQFNGFDLQDGTLKTEVKVSALKGKNAYKNTQDFIEKYRQNESQDELFDLNFVNSFEGNDAILFNAEFTLKDPVKKAKPVKQKENKAQQTTNKTKSQKVEAEKKQATEQ